MRNLLRFIVRNHIFFLFLLLEIICVSLIFRQKQYHHVKMVNASANLTGSIYNTYSDINAYFSLQQVNDSLAREIADLQHNRYQPERMPVPMPSVDSTFALDTIDSTRSLYQFIPAKVIKSSYTHFNNYLTIDKGLEDGVQEGMGVVGLNGVVGIVVGASDHFASVMSLLHHDIRVSCKMKKNELQGTLIWEGTDPTEASLDYVTEPANLKEGDTIVTAGSSTFFPPGQMVGTIKSYSITPGANFYNITVRLSTRFDQLSHVFAVKYERKKEQLNLEAETQ